MTGELLLFMDSWRQNSRPAVQATVSVKVVLLWWTTLVDSVEWALEGSVEERGSIQVKAAVFGVGRGHEVPYSDGGSVDLGADFLGGPNLLEQSSRVDVGIQINPQRQVTSGFAGE